MRSSTLMLAMLIALHLAIPLRTVEAGPQGKSSYTPICIHGDSDFEKWGMVIHGEGSEEKPYVLENLTIKTTAVNGIEVWNTSSHFVIRNMVLEGDGSHVGVCLRNVKNLRIEGCDFRNNTFGIMLQNSSYVTVAGCRVSYGSIGVFLNSSSSITIVGCQASNSSIGIYLKLSSNCLIAGCILSGNGNSLVLDSSSQNIAVNNTIVKNSLGILVHSSSNSTVFNNRFDNPANWSVAGNSTGNRWNASKVQGRNIIGGPCIGGNYWSDYKGVDEDKDGVGDTDIPYGPGDHLPLVKYGNTPPEADFFHHPLRVTCVSEVSFLDNSTDPDGEVVSWTWFFGDGGNASGRVATHVFTKKGNYTVRLMVTDDEGLTDSCEKTIIVYNSPPRAGFTYSPKEPHANETVTFVSNSTDPDGRVVSWEWFFGDGGEALGESVVHTYLKEGNYTVTLLVSDDEGEADWCLLKITVKPVKTSGAELGVQQPMWILILPIALAVAAVAYMVKSRFKPGGGCG